jgi:perosamine synthetase
MSEKQRTAEAPKVRIAKPFNDEAIERGIISVLRSGMLVQGAKVKEFELRLAEYIGCRNVVAVNSGTAALQVAIDAVRHHLRKPKQKGGDQSEIITSPLSFAATANAALACGVTPVFADVDPETFNIDYTGIEELIDESTIAIEPVDVYGLPASLDKIGQLAKLHGLYVVEDAAEAIGATLGGKKIGNVSDVSCFSTYATKNLHTAEGGFVATNDDSLAEFMRMMRNQGQESRYNQKILGSARLLVLSR